MIAILDIGNARNVQRAFAAVEVETERTLDPAVVTQADKLVVPGQGHFGQVMTLIRERALEAPIREHIAAGKPYLGICVGMQILCTESEEAPGVKGLGVWDVRCGRLPRIHMGWDKVDSDRFYFCHRYAPMGDMGYIDRVGLPPNIIAVQYHPEKSHRAGLELLKKWGQA